MESSEMDYRQLCTDYERIEQAIRYLDAHVQEQPDLKQVANYLGLSEYHFQRLFSRWAGISPKRFLQYLTKEHARLLLDQSGSLLEAAYGAGLSGPGRLHDLFVTCEAITPGEHKSGGAGLKITYGIHPGPFGECLIAITERGICSLQFVEDGDRVFVLDRLHARWPLATIVENPDLTESLVHSIFPLFDSTVSAPLSLHLHGTNFQIKVWEALLNIPSGSATSYERIAQHIGRPNAVRAVGQAVAHNQVAVLIPCHRVLRKAGDFGGYLWGVPRKKALLAWEAARSEMQTFVIT